MYPKENYDKREAMLSQGALDFSTDTIYAKGRPGQDWVVFFGGEKLQNRNRMLHAILGKRWEPKHFHMVHDEVEMRRLVESGLRNRHIESSEFVRGAASLAN